MIVLCLSAPSSAQDLAGVTHLQEIRILAERALTGDVPAGTDLKRLAGILLSVRDFESASALYENAYISSGGEDLESLLFLAATLVETGALPLARRRAQVVLEQAGESYELKRRAYTLIARTLLIEGRADEANPMLRTLAELGQPELVEPETLLALRDTEQLLDVDVPIAISLLEELHPQSIAGQLSEGGRFHQPSLPSSIVTRALLPAETQELEPAVPRVTAIQVGSFSDEENAIHMARDLEAIGLGAEVTTSDRDGAQLALVIVRVDEADPNGTSTVLAALDEAGYSGFLIY